MMRTSGLEGMHHVEWSSWKSGTGAVQNPKSFSEGAKALTAVAAGVAAIGACKQ